MAMDTTLLPTPSRAHTRWMTGVLATSMHLAALSPLESVSGATNTENSLTSQ
jgi:hypothetical protein